MNRHGVSVGVVSVCFLGSVGGLATIAAAQPQVGHEFRLDLSMVARRGNPATGIEDVSGPVVIQNTERIRIELRYRIADLVANNVASRGLTLGFGIQIRNNRGSVAGNVERSYLTNSQLSPGAYAPTVQGALNPDTSGQDDFSNTGMAQPFRDGLTSNTSTANGLIRTPTGNVPGVTIEESGFEILPLALAGVGQQSWTGSAATNIGPANTNTNLATWALYSFDYIPAANFTGEITFTSSITPDPQSGNTFGFYARIGTQNPPAPASGAQYTPGSVTINVIPAPGSGLAMLAGAALLARRRR